MAIFNQEYIKEMSKLNNDKNSVLSFAILFYAHMIKWFYQRSHQEASWVNTINTTREKIALLVQNTNVKNHLINNLQWCYAKGLEKASNETCMKITDSEVISNFGTVEDIINSDKVKEWLKMYQNPNKRSFVV